MEFLYKIYYLILVSCIAVAVLYPSIVIYNDVVSRKNLVVKAEGDIAILEQRRYDLVLQLIDYVVDFVKYEKHMIEKVTEMRLKLYEKRISVEGAIREVLAVGESYPKLMSSNNFATLQRELGRAEEALSEARVRYNDAVYLYNTACVMFPWVIFAKLMGMRMKPMYDVPMTKRGIPKGMDSKIDQVIRK